MNSNGITLVIVIITIVIVYSIYSLYKYFNDDVSYFITPDQRSYEVRNGSDDTKEKAAKYLSDLNDKIDAIVIYMKKHNAPDAITAGRLYDRWTVCKLRETASSDSSVAFTINKGREIRICIRSGDTFEDPNTSLFVILHELAHVMSVTYGHNEEFYKNFTFITTLASRLGLYKPENFSLEPKNYCGISISSTPLYN